MFGNAQANMQPSGMFSGQFSNTGVNLDQFLKNPDLTNPMGEMMATQLSH
jgi:hypothetical protein